jgi:hypothetical protein
MIITDNFKYCATTESSLRLNIDNLCPQNSGINKNFNNLFSTDLKQMNFTVLSKRQHKVSGLGIQCSKEIITLNCTMYWYLAKEIQQITETLQLTREDCVQMVYTKRCGDAIMNCENDECSYEQLPKPDYAWNKLLQIKGVKCSIKKIAILATDDTKPIFPNAVQTCYPQQLQCQLRSSIIIWESDIIHSFPYDFVLEDTFITTNSEENKINNGVVIYSDKNQILLNIIDTTVESNISIYKTSEGLFLVDTLILKSNSNINLQNNKDNIQAINQLQLAENDFRLQTLMKLHFRWNIQHCYVMKSLLSICQTLEHHFFKLNDIDGNELIIYSAQGMLYIPHCINVTTIDTINNPIHCYSNIPISFAYNNVTKLAFLHSNRIISDIDTELECENKKQFVKLTTLIRIIKVIGKIVSIEYETENEVLEINFMYNNFENLNYMHYKE